MALFRPVGTGADASMPPPCVAAPTAPASKVMRRCSTAATESATVWKSPVSREMACITPDRPRPVNCGW